MELYWTSLNPESGGTQALNNVLWQYFVKYAF